MVYVVEIVICDVISAVHAATTSLVVRENILAPLPKKQDLYRLRSSWFVVGGKATGGNIMGFNPVGPPTRTAHAPEGL